MAEENTQNQENKLAPRAPIGLDDRGMVQLTDLGQRRTYLAQMLQSSMLPQQYKTIQQVELAWDLLTSMGLPPLPYLPLVVIVNNRLTVMSDALMAACERTGELEWVDVQYIDKQNEPLKKDNAATFQVEACVVTAKRKGRPEQWSRFTLAQADAAGLRKKGGPWTSYPEDMLMHRARARVLRGLFSDSIGGVRVKELDEFVAVTDDAGVPIVTPDGQNVMRRRGTPALDLNAMYASAKAAEVQQ